MFVWPARVYWEDTDAGGVVYHASYLRFLERARSEWLRSRGIVQSQLRAESGLVFTLVNLSINYRRAARLDDQLLVSCETLIEGGASMNFRQSVWRSSETRELLLDATIRAACVDAVSFKPRRMPAALRAMMQT
jgi:acyl-CoA thioester hydrolase